MPVVELPIFATMRGAVLELDDVPINRTSVSQEIIFLPAASQLPQGSFSLRGELMHAFISYRVSTEGSEGNGLSVIIAEKIRTLSMDSRQELQIPRHGWGVWPRIAKQPVPFRKEEAKVFLDRECLQDGQSWLAGFVKALVASMVVVPLLSWTDDDKGSVGELSRIGDRGFDRVDNLLLELILATALREEPASAVQAVLPLMIGPARTAAEGGGFGSFPFHKLAVLSDEPSRATNAQAGAILRQLGLSEDKVQAVLGRSVKQVVGLVLRNQGVQASQWGGVEGVVAECGTRVLKTVLQEMRRLRSDPKYFEQGRPMGSEVLEWLQVENLRSYAPLFIHHDLDSLAYVARLEPEGIHQIIDEHQELYPRSGKKGVLGGELQKLETVREP
ncbi:hypothetical protein T484DRAFT_3485030 [Baffinella frigidus]|nr:hypothetical protein T484DRAFT_3485030 [Cryptophyta sp. CCMP2293]